MSKVNLKISYSKLIDLWKNGNKTAVYNILESDHPALAVEMILHLPKDIQRVIMNVLLDRRIFKAKNHMLKLT